ncbi:hypothetical protein M8J76_000948 [Diaphorina citri]|nr:hypothetical protein M8J76_000948 [Diaphorina citri]
MKALIGSSFFLVETRRDKCLQKLMSKTDLMKALIGSGFFLVETRRDKRLQKLVAEYESAQQDALKNRYNMWEYGDIREDDDRDFRG